MQTKKARLENHRYTQAQRPNQGNAAFLLGQPADTIQKEAKHVVKVIGDAEAGMSTIVRKVIDQQNRWIEEWAVREWLSSKNPQLHSRLLARSPRFVQMKRMQGRVFSHIPCPSKKVVSSRSVQATIFVSVPTSSTYPRGGLRTHVSQEAASYREGRVA